MAFKAPEGKGGKQFAPQANIVAGTYPARIVQIIDYGLQPQRPYKGEDKPPCNEIGFTYELVDEFMKDEEGNDIEDKPRWVSETLPFHSLKADKAKSTHRYEALDPDHSKYDGDFSQLLTLPLNVTIVNNKVGDKVYDNIAHTAGMRPKDADKCPALKNPARSFYLDSPDMEVFNSFPKWIQDKIKGNLNFKGSKLESLLTGKPVKGEVKQEAPWEDHPEAAKEDESNNPY